MLPNVQPIKRKGKPNSVAGQPCGPNDHPCQTLEICPEKDEVGVTVLAANMGGCDKTPNADSIVTKLTFGDLSILLSGDFEGVGPQAMVTHYKDDNTKPLETKVYHVAHHGASSQANKEDWLKLISPEAVVSSGDPWYQYRHPRCKMIKRLLQMDPVSLCEPEGKDDKTKCPDGTSKQSSYTCGNEKNIVPSTSTIDNNKYAIYTTTPGEQKMNLIHVTSTNDEGGWKITYENMDQIKNKEADDKDKTPDGEGED